MSDEKVCFTQVVYPSFEDVPEKSGCGDERYG